MKPRHRNSDRGVLYNRKAMMSVSLLLAVVLAWQFALAQGSPEAPEPAPTDAVEVNGRRLRVEGRASLSQGMSSARYAALLQAYSRLLRHGLENGLFPGAWGENRGGFRFYRVDADHPSPDVMSWLSRSKVSGERDVDGERVLTLVSPEVGSLANAQPELRAMTTQDVDGDGLSDMVGVGYDGSLYILQSPSDGESKVKARSESYALLEIVSGPDFERVRAVFPQDIGSIERLGNNQARLLLELEILEMVNGRLLGRTVERREVIISLEHRVERIRFSLSDPPDFARLFGAEVELRGTAISEYILENVEIRHNGQVAWESPQGIGIRALNFNLERELSPGWNSFRLMARDKDGFSKLRELWVEGPQGRSAGRALKRAVVVSLDNRLKAEKVRSALSSAGFGSQNITILEGKEATASALLAAISEGKSSQELFLYCESQVRPGALVGGKVLLFPDAEVAPSDLAQALQSGGYQKTVALFHGEIPREMKQGVRSQALWRDTATFLQRLGDAGRLVVANVESPREGVRSQRKASRARLQAALQPNSGSDLARLLNTKQPSKTVFRGWMHGTPVLQR